MATDRAAVLAVPAAAAMLLWPAVWNGYPIVFADTGTYLSQAIHHYAGWDRPVFYSVFMLALHWTRTLWPVVAAQALLAAWMLWLVWRVVLPGHSARGFLILMALLAVGTWLPWLVSELMPDVFTPLLILALCLLGWTPEALRRWQLLALEALATLCIATQQSSVPLTAGMLLFIAAAQALAFRRTGLRQRLTRLGGRLAPPLVLALLLTSSVNWLAHHRFSPSPFGNVFLLARVIYDGPGLEALRTECETRHWQLCLYRDRLPDSSDEFLWAADSPLTLAGGAKRMSEEADAIIAAALRVDPAGQLRASLGNSWTQLRRFESGDGLQPWPDQVSHWIAEDFPVGQAAAYRTARQQQGRLTVPGWMAAVHEVAAVAGVIVSAIMLVVARDRRPVARFWSVERQPSRSAVDATEVSLIRARSGSLWSAWIMTILVALPLCAAITGALSTPHDRYQARIMWLPPFMAALAVLGTRPR